MARRNVPVDGDGDWVRPHWLERQGDSSSRGFVSSDDLRGLVNQTRRNWTVVGNIDSEEQATVDPRGLVTPWPGGWSLDWWIGADDRWHVPSREVSVRQRLVDATPVVETAMRIPGGDAVQRVCAMRRSSLDGGGELLLVEVENGSRLPVALALAVRPYNAEGMASVGSIDLRDGTTVTVDDRPALLLPKPPARVAASTFATGDSALTVLSGAAADDWGGAIDCADGLAQAALVYPLAHGAVLRVALPLGPPPRARRRGLRRSQVAAEPTSFPQAVPAPSQVAKGWVTQTQRGLRLELPDARLAEAVDANRRALLLMHDKPDVAAPPGLPVAPGDEVSVVAALDLHGFHDEATALLLSYATRQRSDGAFVSRHRLQDGDVDGALLWVLGRHWRLTRDEKLVEALVDTVVASAHRQGRSHRRGGQGGGEAWRVIGLRAAAELLHAANEPGAANETLHVADGLGGQDPAAAPVEVPPGSAPSGAARGPDQSGTDDDGRLRPALLLHLAHADLLVRNPGCLDLLGRVLDAATPTWTWPQTMDPEHGGGVAGAGHDVPTTAALLTFVRDLLVSEDGDDGLALAQVVPESWRGQGWEVHDAPTDHGRLSYAVRWHGPRPALLWQLDREGHDDSTPVRLSAPGLDPTWSSTDPRGEALLK